MTKKQAFQFLRISSLLDGISFLVLLGIAMPLKYGAGKPEAVRVVGSLHGLFFVMLAIAVLLAWGMMKWKFSRPVIIMFCSVIPFAPFWLEHQLKKEQGSLKP